MPLPQCKTELQRVLGMFSYYARWRPNFSSKIRPLVQSNVNSSFPLSSDASRSFSTLRSDLAAASVSCIQEGVPFVLECDAAESALAATLNQDGKPVAFHSRTFSKSEACYSTVEKEAAAIMDGVRKWSHFLHGKHFTLITDQQAVSFMFNPSRLGKIKNMKIQTWRAELGNFDYEIQHLPGKENYAPDALSRLSLVIGPNIELLEIHEQLSHLGILRLFHFIRTKNLPPYSTEDVKKVCSNCRVCAELKPRFYKKPSETLIKSTSPWERISVDFKGPVEGKNRYILFVVDEFSRYPFAFACSNLSTSIIIQCLSQLFCLFGFPMCIHSDRGSTFVSAELKQYLNSRVIATTTSTPYHLTGNAQIKRLNQTVWRTLQLLLRTHKQPTASWETLLPEALHAVRSLLCTATYSTPHERFFGFTRRSMIGKSLPSWLVQSRSVLRRFVRDKSDPLVEEVELLETNPSFAKIRFPSGRESTVSISDLAPCPQHQVPQPISAVNRAPSLREQASLPSNSTGEGDKENNFKNDTGPSNVDQHSTSEYSSTSDMQSRSTEYSSSPRRSDRQRRPPQRYGQNIYDK